MIISQTRDGPRRLPSAFLPRPPTRGSATRRVRVSREGVDT